MNQVRLNPPNSLPVPFAVISAVAVAAPVEVQNVDHSDNFPKGEVLKFFPNEGTGIMRDTAGREIFFSLSEMDFVGGRGKGSIKDGITVGYDMVRAGQNLHIKKMKIY